MKYSCLNWGYNLNVSNKTRNRSNDKWFYYYDNLTRQPESWYNECLLTAQQINESTDLTLNILLSGGVDSICCAESFRHANIKFTAIIIDFNYNHYDIKYAIEYCKKFSIPHKIIEIDVIHFFDHLLDEYSEYTQNRNPQLVFQAYMTELVNGFPIFGLGELYLSVGKDESSANKTHEQSNKVYAFEGEQYQAIEKLLLHRNKPGAAKFFSYTTELKLATLTDPLVVNWVNNIKHVSTEYYNKEIKNNFKNIFYLEYFPNVGHREPIDYIRFKGSEKIITRNDYTGFELISDVHKVYQEKLYAKFNNDYNNFSWIPYADKIKELRDTYE